MDFPESSSQAMLVGIVLVGVLGVSRMMRRGSLKLRVTSKAADNNNNNNDNK